MNKNNQKNEKDVNKRLNYCFKMNFRDRLDCILNKKAEYIIKNKRPTDKYSISLLLKECEVKYIY